MAKMSVGVKVAWVTGGLGLAGIIVKCVLMLLKPSEPPTNANTLTGSNSTQSPVLQGNSASNITVNTSNEIHGSPTVIVAASNISGSPISVPENRGVVVSQSSNVNVTTVGEVNVAPGGVGINQGTIDHNGGGK